VSFWRTIGQTVARNPISLFAVLCVAGAAAFLGYMTSRMASVLESAKWCGTAINAEKISPGSTFVGLTTCVDLLKIQLEAMATGFHISVGAFAFSLIVLIVIVVAGARASGKIGATGLEFDVNKHAAAEQGAEHVLAGAADAAAEVKGG
jgi:hypothetical protein